MTAEPEATAVAPPSGGATVRVRRWTRITVRVLAATYCWTLFWLLIWTMAPRLVGWEPVVIESGSMAPLIRVGDVVVIERDVTIDELDVGQIVTYSDPVNGQLTTHRIEAHDGDAITTKGDANRIADTTPLDGATVHGRARIVVPAVGLPRAWHAAGHFGLVVTWAVLTLAALWLSLSPPDRLGPGSPAPRGRRSFGRPAVATVLIAVMAAGAAPGSTRAAFGSLVGNGLSGFTAAASFGLASYAEEVLADGPEAYWRLGDSAALPAPAFTDDLETFSGWSPIGAGSVAATSTVTHGGVGALTKDQNDDSGGGWKALGTALPDSWTLEAWLYRPPGLSGDHALDRLGIEDGSFNGYSFGAAHRGNTLFIDRRDGGASTTLASTHFNPPAAAWYRLVLTRAGGGLTLAAFDAAGVPLASVAAADTTYMSFDRVAVHGDWGYFVDDISVWAAAAGMAVDQMGEHSAPYGGWAFLGQPGLLVGDPDHAVGFDGGDDVIPVRSDADLDLAPHGRRTVELWFRADATTFRQVLYEEGGKRDGLALYLDGGVLRGRAWSRAESWSNELDTSVPVAPGTVYHVALVLDATGNTLTLHLNGVAQSTATKTDGRALGTHGDGIGIAAMQRDTRFHDGQVTGDGYWFAGVLDEVAVYNLALPPERIQAHYVAGT